MSTVGVVSKEPDPRVVYADIIDLPHHQSQTCPHMSMYNRAAQFSAFDALAGFSDMVKEEARLTDRKTELEGYELEELNRKLNRIADEIEQGERPRVIVRYFVPDARKDGGSYETYTGVVKKVDAIDQRIIFYDPITRQESKSIDLAQVIEIQEEAHPG